MASDSSRARDEGDAPKGVLDDSRPQVDPDDEGRAAFAELTVGAIVDGRYRIDRVMGRGAMGVVVAATHTSLGESVALKFLRYRAKVAGEEFQSRFKREAKVSAMLRNEHITRVIDVGLWREHVPYMVMDYLNGSDLREIMKVTGQFPVDVALDFIIQVCEGIAEAHANGIVHRDLKPSNLFVTKRPDGTDLIKILDFGISKWRAGETEIGDLTETGVVLGSPKYMAPEQLFGSAGVDARADVWSIGAILYELLAGKPPFDLPTFTRVCAELSTNRMPPSLVAMRPEISPALEAVVMKCFARDPEERVHDVAELAGTLLDAVEAPFALPVRQKIAAMLDRGGPGMSMPSGAYSTGGYATMSTSSASGSYRNMPPSAPASTSAAVRPPVVTPAPRRPVVPALVAAAVVAVGAIAYFASTGGREAPAPAAAAPAITAAPAAAPLPAPQATSAAAATEASAAATATASARPSAQPDVAAPAVRTGRPAPARPVVVVHVAPPPPPPPVAAPPAAAPPPPAPVATAPAAPKADPLGDRQ